MQIFMKVAKDYNEADYLVIGRPIRDANDPKEAVIKITEEIEDALQ